MVNNEMLKMIFFKRKLKKERKKLIIYNENSKNVGKIMKNSMKLLRKK